MKWFIAVFLLASLVVPAAAFWQSRDSNYNVNITGGGGGSNGKILLVDGVSFVLQTDAASKICRAAGC